jgi:hypothetical protein
MINQHAYVKIRIVWTFLSLDVDTNRNFPTDFNDLHVDPSSDLYGGVEPLDQPLSQCLDQLFT